MPLLCKICCSDRLTFGPRVRMNMTIETIPMGFFDGIFFTNVIFFLLLMITLLGGFIGVTSGYASIGAFGAFTLFVHVASQVVDIQGSMLTIVFIFMSATLWGIVSSSGDMR